MKTASMSRYCEFWKASNGKWYIDVADEEYGDYEDSTTYGPFASEDAADRWMSRNLSNPGASDTDDSGDRPPPVKSPNGRKVVNPIRRGSLVERVAARYLLRLF